MRLSYRRILTVFPLFTLVSLSFFAYLVEGTAIASPDVVARHSRQFAAKRAIVARQGGDGPDFGNAIGGNDESPGSSSSTRTESTSTSSNPRPTSTRSSPSSSSTDDFTSRSTRFSETGFSSTSTTTSESTSSTTSSSFSSSSSSTTSSSTSTSTSRTSSSTTSTSLRTTSQTSTRPTSTGTTFVVPNTLRATTISTTSAVQTSAEATSTEAASSNGFLSNKGAMAGTFTALGLVVIGGICAVVLYIRKKKRSEDLDIFDTEYNEYQAGNGHDASSGGHGDYFASDMTSLSANAVSHAGAYSTEPDYGRADYGFGPPPAVDRNSVASNHAGYGAFQAATQQSRAPMQSSGLRSEVTWGPDAAYAEPAVAENQSINVAANSDNQYYTPAVRVPGTAY